jgi:hypothetical protein
MSKRTPWFNAKTEPPVNGTENSKYEWRCRRGYGIGRRTIWWLYRWSCPDCQWRGLTRPAEE